MNAASSSPMRYLVGGEPQAVVVPARVARYLDRAAVAEIRRKIRGADRELDEVLAALHLAGLQYAEAAATSPGGRTPLPQAPRVSTSGHDLLDTAAVAQRLGCGPRNVRDLHERGRLVGDRVAGRLLFAPAVVDGFLADRAS